MFVIIYTYLTGYYSLPILSNISDSLNMLLGSFYNLQTMLSIFVHFNFPGGSFSENECVIFFSVTDLQFLLLHVLIFFYKSLLPFLVSFYHSIISIYCSISFKNINNFRKYNYSIVEKLVLFEMN